MVLARTTPGVGVCETIARMDSSLRAELNSLRLRAYGRSANGALDPETVRRLQELEACAREDGSVHVDGSAKTSELPVPSEDASSTFSPEAREPPAAKAASPVESHAHGLVRRSWRGPSRVMLALWTVSVATSAAIAAAATFSVVGILPVAVVNNAPQIATLEPNPAITVPVGFSGAGASSIAYEFYGLTLFETSWNMSGVGGVGGDCFVAVLTSDIPEEENVQGGYTMSGPSYGGCRVGNFPATVTMAVDSSAPPELRTEFPNGVVQFVKDGDRIGVFLGDSLRD